MLVVLHKWLKLQIFAVVSAVALAVVLAPSTAMADESVWVKASTITDPDLDESSSLAVSKQFIGVAYTANDEDEPVIYAVDIPSGDVVGVTRLEQVKLRDPEAMALDRWGTVWLADAGDNKKHRSDVALYAFSEQGPSDTTVSAVRYPIEYSDGAKHNVETLLVNPVTDAKYLVTKTKKGHGDVFALPAVLNPNAPNVARDLDVNAPRKLSDGAFSPNGAWVVLRDKKNLYVYGVRSRSLEQTVAAPPVRKGESVSFNPSGRSILLGSEGEDSPLYWVGFDQKTGRVPTR